MRACTSRAATSWASMSNALPRAAARLQVELIPRHTWSSTCSMASPLCPPPSFPITQCRASAIPACRSQRLPRKNWEESARARRTLARRRQHVSLVNANLDWREESQRGPKKQAAPERIHQPRLRRPSTSRHNVANGLHLGAVRAAAPVQAANDVGASMPPTVHLEHLVIVQPGRLQLHVRLLSLRLLRHQQHHPQGPPLHLHRWNTHRCDLR